MSSSAPWTCSPLPCTTAPSPSARYVKPRRCEACQAVGDAVRLALTAAHYDELGSAAQLLDTAEQLATAPAPASPCAAGASEPGRGQVRRWAETSAPLVAATDASWKGRAGGIGYVVSDGHYGLRSRGPGRSTRPACSRVLVSELRAVEFLLTAYDEAAGRHDGAAWTACRRCATCAAGRAARPGRCPPATTCAPARWADSRPWSGSPSWSPARPDLTFAHVKAHADHALNEAADSLAHMARRRVEEPFDVHARAHDLVEAFLRDWHVALAA